MPTRPRRHKTGPEHVSPNLTPLLDVVLQLITFFMMLVHFGSKVDESKLAVKLPVAPAALPGADPGLDRLTVSLDATGRLVSASEEVPESLQAAWWSKQAAIRREGTELLNLPAATLATRVLVRGDRRLPYGRMRRTLAESQQAGFGQFSLIVSRKEEPSP
jgi:biopolymer transport protein ExbD